MLAPKSYLLALSCLPETYFHSVHKLHCVLEAGSELHGVSCFGDECMKVC